MDMSGIRKYFDHQDGWGADWVKRVVDLSTKVLEVFTVPFCGQSETTRRSVDSSSVGP